MIYKIVYRLIPVVFVFLLQNCSFYSFKGSIPAHINSVVIYPLKNETSEFLITELLNEKILNAILLENILDVVSFENADSKLDIIIKSLSDKPNVYDIDEQEYEVVNEWKITMTINVVWYDLIIKQDLAFNWFGEQLPSAELVLCEYR